MLKCQSEPVNLPVSISHSKEMGHCTRQRKEKTQEQIVGDNSGGKSGFQLSVENYFAFALVLHNYAL